jgi:gas vesicle protein
MPANEKSYENGKIYRIWSLDTDKIYIGSTADTLSNRFCSHKASYKCWKNGKGVFYSSFNLFELVGVDNCKIELEHNFSCESKTKLNKEEGRLQRLYKDIIVNRAIAGRTDKEYLKEYRQQHKEEIKEHQKEYYQEHKDELNEKSKEYHQQHKEEIKEKVKKYQEYHKEELKQYQKEYHQQHKEEIKQKHTCECGGKYTMKHKQQHFKTTKHLNYINSQGLQTQTQNN